MKRTGKVLAILLALAMLLSVTAFAAWDVYGSNANHNSVVDSAPTTATTTALNSYIDLSNGGRGWDGVDNVPVMETVNGTTYAYVLYDGYSSYGGQLAKINCSAATPYVVWHKQISASSGFQLSTPYLDTADRAIYIGASNASVYNDVAISSPVALTANTAGTVTISGLTLLTAANRVSVPVYVGHTSVADRGTLTTEGTATIQLGGGTAVNLTLSTTQASSGTNYKIYEQATYDDDGNVTGYDYYYYINHSVTASSTENATLSISVTLNGTGTIESVSMFANKGAVTKITGIDSADVSNLTLTSVVSSVNGQINTPITRYGDYIYFGTWSGYTQMQYYQVDVSDEDYTTVTYTGNAGFYWAGAVKLGNYIYFGGDATSSSATAPSYLYYRSESDFDTVGGAEQLPSGAGNVRSTVMTDGTYLYFTSQGGYLWCYKPNATTGAPELQWSAELGATSTSTPTKVGDRIYVGVYSGFNKGGVKCVSASTHAVKDVIAIADKNNFPVQCSIVVKGDGTGTDYLFFNTNSGSKTDTNENFGCGFCYSYDGTTATKQWASRSDTYALGGMACDNGIIVFGNDYDHLYVVK